VNLTAATAQNNRRLSITRYCHSSARKQIDCGGKSRNLEKCDAWALEKSMMKAPKGKEGISIKNIFCSLIQQN
jgi:hypothetical protein